MLNRRNLLTLIANTGWLAFAKTSFANPPKHHNTYFLPFSKLIVLKPGRQVLNIEIPLKLTYNIPGYPKVMVSNLTIETKKATSWFNGKTKKITVSPSEILTDSNGVAIWKASINLSAGPDKSDEIITISPYFSGKGNLKPSLTLNTVSIYIRYRK